MLRKFFWVETLGGDLARATSLKFGGGTPAHHLLISWFLGYPRY
jgi:hypothetical protein